MSLENLQNSLQGKVAVITGASAGVGWHTAKLFARQGARVVVTARRKERLKQLVEEIRATGGEAVYFAGDASTEECAKSTIDIALRSFGRLDILINSAGQGNYKNVVETSLAEYDQLMNSNMRSSFIFSRIAAPHFIAQRAGTLLFISSVSGTQSYAGEAVYCATKHAQVGFALALDGELRHYGVKVGVLCPGGIKTEFAVGKGRTVEGIAASTMMEPSEFAEDILLVCLQPEGNRIVQMMIRPMGEAHS
jgi:3-oxoacyl-[acyl-carrier protein] reductase